MRWFKLLPLVLLFSASALGTEAANGRIIKVLPHLLDRDGRHTLSPSLYERDAYQAFLRKNPGRCSGLRFDIQWKAKQATGTRLLLRVEIRGSKEARPVLLEQPAWPNHWYRRWSSLRVDGDSYQKVGEMLGELVAGFEEGSLSRDIVERRPACGRAKILSLVVEPEAAP